MAKRHEKKRQKGGTSVTPPVGFDDAAVSRIRELTGTLCESEGMELVHVECQREPQGRILRVYIDKPGGVGLNDCVHISRQLGDLLDVYIDREEAYHLEVSSPGSERPLGKLEDFERFKGKVAKIRTKNDIAGQKNFTGRLLGADQDTVRLEKNGAIVEMPYSEILKARLVYHNGENEC